MKEQPVSDQFSEAETAVAMDAIESQMTIVATAEVQHHAPCVPECPVCYPTGRPAESEDR